MIKEKTNSEHDIQEENTESTTKDSVIDSYTIFKNLIDSKWKHYNIFDQKQAFQAFLAVMAFISFGICDSVTGALMMNLCGTCAEANPLMRHLVDTQGYIGFILFKLLITTALLSIIIIIQDKSNETTYWTTNGFLVSFGIGGVLATTSNLMRTFSFNILGNSTPSPLLVVFIYFILTALLITIGGAIDKKDTIS